MQLQFQQDTRRTAWILVIQAALWGATLSGSAIFAHAVPTIDEPAPPLKGTLFDGKAFDLAGFKGKVVLVNFFSSYCKFCAYEIGNLENYYEEFKSQGFEVLAINIDAPGDKERAARMANIYNLPGAMVSDLSESGFEKNYPTPTCFILDRKGYLRAKLTGAKQPKFYRDVIEPLLKE